MNHDHDYWIHRLSEVVDDTLEPAERRAARAHLASCGRCREIVADLSRVVREARSLGGVPPGRDLWPGIEAALRPGDPDVLVLPTAKPEEPPTAPASLARGGLFLSVPQIAVAAAILMVVSSLLTLWARPDVAPGPDTVGGPSAVRPAAVQGAPPELARELASLTEALRAGEEGLDPATRRVIVENLVVIERAIEDSQRALALDPANAFLQEHLDRAYERKLAYLQEAAGIVEWASS